MEGLREGAVMLAEREVTSAMALQKGLAAFILDPKAPGALGLDDRLPIFFSARIGPAGALEQGFADLERLLQTPEILERWLVDNPIQGAFLHARIVGQSSTSGGNAAELLSKYLGGVQSVTSDDDDEAWASLLLVESARLGALRARIYPGSHLRLHRPLETSTMVLIIERAPAPGQAVAFVDVLVDLELGGSGLLAGLEGLTQPPVDGSQDSPGLPSGTDVARLVFGHRGWAQLVRGLRQAEAVRQMEALKSLPIEVRGAEWSATGRRIRMTSQVFAPAESVFDRTEVRIGLTPRHLSVELRSRYLPTMRALGGLREPRPALPFQGFSDEAELTVNASSGGPSFFRVLESTVPAPALPFERLVSEVTACGLVCLLALPTAAPAYARAPLLALTQLAPAFEPLAPALQGAAAVSMAVRWSADAAVAIAIRGPRPMIEVEPHFRALELVFRLRSHVRERETLLLVDSRGGAPFMGLDRAVAAPDSPSRAFFEIRQQGPLFGLFKSGDLRMTFEPTAMLTEVALPLLPVLSTSELRRDRAP